MIARSGPFAVVSHPVVADYHRHHIVGIGLSLGSGDGDRGRDRSRDAFSALALSLPPAGGGAGGNPGGGSGGPRGTSGSSKKVNLCGDGGLVSSPPSFSCVLSRS